MRWPLRYQVMLPMIGVMLGTLVGVSALNAYFSGRRAKAQIERQLREVTATLSDSNFPLTDPVLRQMSGLTGAEFIVSENSGQVIASLEGTSDLPLQSTMQKPGTLTLGRTIDVGGQRYFHTAVALRRRGARADIVPLDILYPEQSYREAWRQAAYPPLAIGGVALLLVAMLATAIASRVGRPMRRLQSQVGRIAGGDFHRIELPDRDDEVRDLGESVNRMAELLERYEDEVRASERLRTLGQLGSGIAHQMRNAATGCRLAIELHQRECQPDQDCECLEVANRQLTLMEKQLERFLSLGTPNARATATVDLVALIENILPLLGPYARHLEVAIRWSPPARPLTVVGDADSLEQMSLNLMLNAIEAASRCRDSHAPNDEQRKVTVELDGREEGRVSLAVTDAGAGPASSVQKDLFEPFVTEKHDGTGLGLSVAREIALQHRGEINWHRRDSATCFTVNLPASSLEKPNLEKPNLEKPSLEKPSVEVARS